jgi:hypothetical protein
MDCMPTSSLEYFHKILSKVGHGYSIVLVKVAGVFLVSSNVIQSEARGWYMHSAVMQYLVSYSIHSPACYSIATRIHTSPSLLLNGEPLIR